MTRGVQIGSRGVGNRGQGGATAPPIFTEISPNWLQNKGFNLRFLFFAPPHTHTLVDRFQHLWVGTHFFCSTFGLFLKKYVVILQK